MFGGVIVIMMVSVGIVAAHNLDRSDWIQLQPDAVSGHPPNGRFIEAPREF